VYLFFPERHVRDKRYIELSFYHLLPSSFVLVAQRSGQPQPKAVGWNGFVR
jgi:hypothetical protein